VAATGENSELLESLLCCIIRRAGVPRMPCLFAVTPFATILILFTTSAFAENISYFPANQPAIQAGISAASEADTMLVAPGTYPDKVTPQRIRQEVLWQSSRVAADSYF